MKLKCCSTQLHEILESVKLILYNATSYQTCMFAQCQRCNNSKPSYITLLLALSQQFFFKVQDSSRHHHHHCQLFFDLRLNRRHYFQNISFKNDFQVNLSCSVLNQELVQFLKFKTNYFPVSICTISSHILLNSAIKNGTFISLMLLFYKTFHLLKFFLRPYFRIYFLRHNNNMLNLKSTFFTPPLQAGSKRILKRREKKNTHKHNMNGEKRHGDLSD